MTKFKKVIHIGGKTINESSRTFIIAEAGVNHGGDISLAKKLVDVAFDAGADAVKFQAFRTNNLIIENTEKAPYQKDTTGSNESQADMLRKLELNTSAYLELFEYCKRKGILFLITPFDEGSLEELENIGVEAYKIASTDTTNLPFLEKVAMTGKPIILSTGMCYLNEVKAAVEAIQKYNDKLILLQCTANYPIEDFEANLNVIKTFQKEFEVIIGYSDHSVGIGAAPYAVPMGAKVLEKHFTIDKSAEGPDHLASLDPNELKEFVTQVRRIELYLGSFTKEPTKAEQGTRAALQKCLVATRPIKKGEGFSLQNIVGKRTGGKGISPLLYRNLLETKASRDYSINDIIEEKL